MQYTNTLILVTDISLDSVGGLSSRRNIVATTNGGTIVATGSELLLSTNTSANGTAALSTAERITAYPGHDSVSHIGVRMPSLPTGAQVALWGVYDNNEGYGFGVDATDFFTFVKTRGVITKTYKSSWNIDKLNGTGVSGLSMPSTSQGVIFQFRSMWYGGIEYGIYRPDQGMEQANAHRVKQRQPIYLNPYLPLRAEVNNNGIASNLQLAVSVRKSSHLAYGRPSERQVSHSVSGVAVATGSPVPIMSLRRKTGATIPMRFDSLEVLSNQDMEIIFVTGSTVANASWGNPNGAPSGESICEVDTGHGQSSSQTIYRSSVPIEGLSIWLDCDRIPLIESNPITIYANVLGTTSATGYFNLHWYEQW